MSALKRLAGDTLIYGASSILGRLLNYLLVPYYTYVFAAWQYGVITEFYAYAAFLNVLYTYGMETAYFRFATLRKEDEPAVFNRATSAILFSSLVFSGLLFLLATPIIEYLEFPGKENYIRWFAGILAIDAVIAIPFAKLRLGGKATYFATARLINIALNIGLNLFLLSVCPSIMRGEILPSFQPLVKSFYNPHYTLEYVFISNLIANGALIFILWSTISKLRISFRWSSVKPMLVYGYPILFAGLAWVTNEMLSRWALRFWLPEGFYPGLTNQEALGVFGAVYKFSVFMTLFVQAFRYAAEPFFFSRAEEKNSPALFSMVSHTFILIGCVILLGISINLDVLALILRQEVYRQGMHVVPILLLANLFLGVYYNVSIWYKLTNKTYYSTYIAVGAAVLTVVLNYVLIPVAGYEGSSWVTLAAYFFMAVVCYAYGQKHYPIPYPVIKDLTYIVFTVLIIYLVNRVIIHNTALLVAFRSGVLLTFTAIVYALERKNFLTK